MGNTKYTKGGWKIINGWDKDGNGKYFPSVILFGDEKLHNETLGRNSITINVSHDQEAESLMANAKLISAAPDLLEALKDMVFIFESVSDKLPSKATDFNCYNKALTAINKATK